MKKLNAYQLKLIMAALMLLDHLKYIHNFVPAQTVIVFVLISRCVAPMFAYFAVEGIFYTRSIRKYCLRLLLLAGIMFAGNAVLNAVFYLAQPTFTDGQTRLYIGNNVIFTLAAGVLGIALILRGKEKNSIIGYGVASAICLSAGFLLGEWGSAVIPFMLVTYFFRDKKVLRITGYALIEVLALILPNGEPFYFLVFPFILLYNGERGTKTAFGKYFFYVFYPLHLWLIFILGFIITT